MKSIKKLLIVSFIMLMLLGISVYAKDAVVSFLGDDEIKSDIETYSLIVNVSNDDAIGILEGVISYDDNVKTLEITSSYNGWTVTYNEDTGKFLTLNAYGTKDGEVLEVKYTLVDGAQEATITISDIELTTISYDTIEIGNISKTIKLHTDLDTTVDEDETTDETEDVDDEVNNDNTNDEVNEEDLEDDNSETYINENGVIETDDDTVSKVPLPNTGLSIGLLALVIIAVIVAIVLFIKNKKYKEI